MTTTLIVLIIYVIITLIVTFFAQRKTQKGNSTSFLFATGAVPWFMVATMVMCTSIGGTATVGVAENSYRAGISAGWYTVSVAMQAVVFGLIMIRKTLDYNLPTASGMIVQSFSTFDGIVCNIALIILQIALIALQIIAAGNILTAVIPSISISQAMIISAIVFVVIVFVGGYMGATLTNLINAVVIYGGLIVGLIFAVRMFGDGGYGSIVNELSTTNPETPWTSVFSGMGSSVIISWFLVQIFSSPSVQSLYHMSGSARDKKGATKGFIVGAILTAPVGFIAAMIGIVGAKAFPGLEKASLALPMVIASLPPIAAGIILAGLWAASLSSATSILMGLSGTFTRDLYGKYIKPTASEKERLIVSRILIVAGTSIAMLIAMKATGIISLFMLVNLLIIPYGVLLVFMFYAPRFLRKSSCTLTMCGGVIGIILWYAFPAIKPFFFSQNAYLAIPLALIALVISHFVDKRPFDASTMETLRKKPQATSLEREQEIL